MLLTVNELARRLHIKPSTLYAWAARGKIPAVKLNGLLRFHPEDIERWVESCRKEPARAGLKPPAGRQPTPVQELIARAHREVYTPRHGETRPDRAPRRKEGQHGAR